MRSRCSRRSGELGQVTAEFAAAVPAALVIIAIAISGVVAAATHVRLQDAAGDAARAAARGDSPEQFVRGAAVSTTRAGDLVCAHVSQPVLGGALTLTASSCADAAGR